jgi:hypothetical protein
VRYPYLLEAPGQVKDQQTANRDDCYALSLEVGGVGQELSQVPLAATTRRHADWLVSSANRGSKVI